MAVGVRIAKGLGIRDWGLEAFFSNFPVSFPTAKYPPFVSTEYVTGPCKMTLAPVS